VLIHEVGADSGHAVQVFVNNMLAIDLGGVHGALVRPGNVPHLSTADLVVLSSQHVSLLRGLIELHQHDAGQALQCLPAKRERRARRNCTATCASQPVACTI